ncbi:MAG TPA: substrate-binding domain-containing protein [Tepidisphaeraceae bacterium]|jgi:ribose transport system substrate-binding protein|nr:substrate-binding domain-containing protein [Tepidisphaeraceae bacterium]
MTTETSTRPRKSHFLPYLVVLLILIVLGSILYSSGALKPKPHIAVVTASTGPYWDLIIRGAKEAAEKYDARLDVITPPSNREAQSAAIHDLVGKGYDGVAVSPNDPVRQADVLSEIAAEAKLVTFDSDSPISNRICFIGTDNYDAGRTAGQHLKEAVPDGGEVIIAIGSLDKINGQQRRQGVIDELTDRSFEPQRPMDPVDQPIKGAKYTIVATLVDGIDQAKATQLAIDAIKAHPQVKGFVGLFAYSAPTILKALESSGKLDQVKVIGFDTNEETLAGIEQGHVYASMMQDPYYIGLETVRILSEASRGNRQAVPLFQQYNLSCDPVMKSNVAAVREQLAARMSGKAAPMRLPAPREDQASPTTEPSATTTEPAGS